MKLNEDFLAQMRKATQLLRTSGPAAATAAIKRALLGAGNAAAEHRSASDGIIDINPAPDKTNEAPAGPAHRASPDRFRDPSMEAWRHAPASQPVQEVDLDAQPRGEGAGRFLSASCTNRAGTRAYKLYVPGGYNGSALPLIVMLHGCKQHPDDFAAGTGMNRVAEQNNCFVVYPAQAHAANGSNCWNWFNASHQQRDRGEPSIIADITRQVMREYNIDPDRVYVAGLSAGAAMATIVAAAYPELYAAAGIHSGLPAGSAHDVASAFGTMKNGGRSAKQRTYRQTVPAIIFHGDRDHTVHPDNGHHALAQCMAVSAHAGSNGNIARECRAVEGKVPHGRAYTQTIYYGDEGLSIAEHWVVHGAGHAWSGGTSSGSYTDPKGPDASQEMVRFFYAHPRRGKAA
jgi:poly(hydroxyalkanoate) depolymerase family esterase